MFAFRRSYGRQLSNRLTAFVKKEISKVISITTDNAEDIKKAMRPIALRLSCICQNLNLVLYYGVKLWAKPSQNLIDGTSNIDEDLIYYNNYNENDIKSNENLPSDEQLEMHDVNNQVENVCTYVTENVSSDDDKSSEEEEASTNEIVNQLFNFSSIILFRLRKTVALLKRSSIMQSFVFGKIKKQGLKINNLSSDFHVRWNSTFLMISKIITAKNVLS